MNSDLVEPPPAGAGGSLNERDLPRLTAFLPRREPGDSMSQGLIIRGLSEYFLLLIAAGDYVVAPPYFIRGFAIRRGYLKKGELSMCQF
jgi:hypothetical protein